MNPSIVLQLALEHQAANFRNPRIGDYYPSPADLVMRAGRRMVPQPLPRDCRPGLPRLCYHNSIMNSLTRGVPYVEGFAYNGIAPPPGEPGAAAILHAWNLDERGRVVDTTWRESVSRPDSRAYIGIEFSVRRADDCTWHGDATVLDDYNRGWPLLRHEWEGEDSPGEDLEEILRTIMERYAAERPKEMAGRTIEQAVAQAYEFWGAVRV